MPESACHRQGANASVWCFYTEQGAYGALNLEHQMAVRKGGDNGSRNTPKVGQASETSYLSKEQKAYSGHLF